MSDEEEQPNFRVLKTVVILLGIAILVMTGIIIYTAVDRLGGEETAAESAESSEAPANAAPWVFNANTTGIEGVHDAELAGNRVIVETRTPAGNRAFQILDVRSGRLLGTITDK